MSLKSSIVKGAFVGTVAWLAYAMIEFAFTLVIPRIWAPESELLDWQWRVIGILFVSYAFAGALLGACGGTLLARTPQRSRQEHHEIIAGLTLAFAFAVNLLSAWPLARSEQLALAVAAGLCTAFCLGLIFEAGRRRAAFLANPWTLSLLLLCSPWISRETMHDRSAIVKTGISLVVMGALVGIAALLHRFRSATSRPAGRRAIPLAVAGAVLWILTQLPTAGTTVHADQPPPLSSSGKPNVVLITMDTVRADHLSVYGYERDTTPHLREFSKSATAYNHAVAASDMTLPSHASIFTGLYPSWHGAYAAAPDFAYGRPLTPGSTTLASILRSKGYWTGAVVANHSFLQAAMGLAQGFAVWQHNVAAQLSTAERPFYLREGVRKVLSLGMSTAGFDGFFLRASDINRNAFKMLDEARNRGPFFLFLNYMDAHIPLVPPAPFRDLFPGRDPSFRPAVRHQDLTNAINAGRGRLSSAEKQHLVSQYDGGIAYIDSEIGRLLAKLRDMNLYDNTMIVITSDHGEAFDDHGMMQHGVGSVHEEQVHIPLLVKLPGQQQARRSDVPVSHVDIMPTVLAAAGCDLPAGLQGRKLDTREAGGEPVFAEAWALGEVQANPRLRGVRRAIFSGSSKLITSSGGPVQLYDVAADPNELTNRYRPDDPAAAALLSRLNAWAGTIPRQQPKPGKLDKSTMDRIRSLGYTQ